MLYMEDIVNNHEKELSSIEYDYNLKDICNEYKEDDLILYETGNRMSGVGGIFFFRKDGKNRIIFVDEIDDLLYKYFPIAMNLEYKFDNSFENEKYNYFFTGFGGKLYIDKRIYDDFYKNTKELFDKYEIPIENYTPDELFMHGYWLTIAREMFK